MELVMYMNDTGRAVFQGTNYQETYLFYHDAFTPLCKWMQEHNNLRHWISPELDMKNEVIIENAYGDMLKSKRYANRPVGECAEATVPLDNFLFRDLRKSLDIHITLTSLLSKDVPRMFMKGTPKNCEINKQTVG